MRDIVNEVAQMLTQRGLTISVAEACTAGYVGHLLCAPAGASAYFWGGVIAYSGGSKRKLLGVPDALQEQYTSVSPEVVLDMARKVREVMDTDIGISTSGVTGPGSRPLQQTPRLLLHRPVHPGRPRTRPRLPVGWRPHEHQGADSLRRLGNGARLRIAEVSHDGLPTGPSPVSPAAPSRR